MNVANSLLNLTELKNTIMYRANVIDDAHRARELWGMFEEGNWWRQGTGEARLNRTHNDRFLNYWVVMKSKSLREVTTEKVATEFRNLLDTDEYRQTDINEIAEEIKYTGSSTRQWKRIPYQK